MFSPLTHRFGFNGRLAILLPAADSMTDLTATLMVPSAFPQLEADWLGLEQRAERSFFQSWVWASTLIEVMGDGIYIIRVTRNDEVVALGILGAINETRHHFFRFRQLRLNEIGHGSDDVVQPEYNNLLVARDDETAAWRAVFSLLDTPDAPKWDEVILSNTTGELDQIMSPYGWQRYRRTQSGSGYVDLAALRVAGIDDADGYISTLGKSTKGQVRRAFKLYRTRGELTLRRAATVDDAHTAFGELSRLHTDKWHARNRTGLRDMPLHMQFHQRLLERATMSGVVELLTVSVDDEPFAYIHNFVYRGAVLFNVAGYVPNNDNRLKPGLVAHVLAIEEHLRSGAKRYDFLAGDDRYKQNLGQAGPDFVGFAVQRARPGIVVEEFLRRAKSRMQR